MQYDFALAANGGQQIDVKGRFFKYVTGTGRIRVRINKGGYVDLLPGQGVWNVDYETLNISDRTGAVNNGSIVAGEFDFHDDRVSGTVEVVDGGRARVIANQAFMGGTAIISAAGEYPYVQLVNNTSNMRTVIKAIIMSTTAAQQVSIAGYSTSLTTLVGAAQSKMIGGSAAQSQLRTKSDPAVLGAAAFISPYVPANVPFVYVLQEPIVLLPGQGVIGRGTVAATYLGVNFEFTEELIQ